MSLLNYVSHHSLSTMCLEIKIFMIYIVFTQISWKPPHMRFHSLRFQATNTFYWNVCSFLQNASALYWHLYLLMQMLWYLGPPSSNILLTGLNTTTPKNTLHPKHGHHTWQQGDGHPGRELSPWVGKSNCQVSRSNLCLCWVFIGTWSVCVWNVWRL